MVKKDSVEFKAWLQTTEISLEDFHSKESLSMYYKIIGMAGEIGLT